MIVVLFLAAGIKAALVAPVAILHRVFFQCQIIFTNLPNFAYLITLFNSHPLFHLHCPLLDCVFMKRAKNGVHYLLIFSISDHIN